jgi:hypothetical protein
MYEHAKRTLHNEAGRLTTGYSLEADGVLSLSPHPLTDSICAYRTQTYKSSVFAY